MDLRILIDLGQASQGECGHLARSFRSQTSVLPGLGLLEMPEAHLARILLNTNGDGNDGGQINDLRKEKDQVPNLAGDSGKESRRPPAERKHSC